MDDNKSLKRFVLWGLIITNVLSLLSVITIFLNSEICDGPFWLVLLIFLICYIVGVTIYLCIRSSKIRKLIAYIIDLITWL